jgi:predicted deacetylase
MKTMKVILIVAMLFLILAPHEPPAVWIEIHDVSPAYGNGELERVIEVLERHDVERAVIFVIPNHGGSTPLERYPEFTGYLKELQGEGYEVGAHGYDHSNFEFYCPEDEARLRLNLALDEFHAAGLEPQVFSAPGFLIKKESVNVAENGFGEVYFFNKIIKGDENHDYFFHEFTYFHLPKWAVMPLAKASYGASRSDVYRLSVHIDNMDSEHLVLLDEFLDFTDAKNA